MVHQSLKNKKIIISAGASGIGLATAKVCLARGAYVYLCDINKNFINKLKKHPLHNKRLFSYYCDASNEPQVKDFFKNIQNKTKKRKKLCLPTKSIINYLELNLWMNPWASSKSFVERELTIK